MLGEVLARLQRLEKEEKAMNVSLQALSDQAAKNESVEDSAVIILNGISEQLKAALAAGNDPATIKQIADGLDGSAGRLAAAIAANTPAVAAPAAAAPVAAPEVPPGPQV